MTDEEQRNRDRALRYVNEVLTLENVDAIEEIAAPPSEWDEQPRTRDGESPETFEEAKQYFTRAMSRFEDLSISVDSAVADDDEVMVQWEVTGRITEEIFGIPATGRPFGTTAASYFRFDDGRIVEHNDHMDTMDFMPEVAKVARQGVVREMRDGIVVVDENEQIIDVNPATIEMFDYDRDALLGEPVDVLLGAETDTPEAGGSVVVSGPHDRRYFDVGASPLTDHDSNRIGRTLVIRDVTERRRHVQHLEVLNRVLRHNLRNDLQVVRTALEAASERVGEDAASLLARARETTDGLLSTATTARHAQATLEGSELKSQDLDVIVDALVARARETYPNATVDASVSASVTVEATNALEDALWEILSNACEHAGETPCVEISVSGAGETAELTITDDGPGVPEYELRVLDAGAESDLQHGSGLGLWLAHWALEAAGGDLSFDVEDGTVVRVTLPLAVEES